MNERVEMGAVVRGAFRRWWLVVGLTVLFAAGGYAVSLALTPAYRGTTSIMVGESLRASNVTPDDIDSSTQLALAYSDLVRRQPILQDTVESLGLRTTWQELRSRVGVDIPADNPQLIELSVDASSRQEAEATAKEIVDRLIALSPTGSQATGQNFIESRLATIRQNIAVKQRTIDRLRSEAQAANPAEAARLHSEINRFEAQIISWEDSYSTLSSDAGQASNHLEVIEPAQASANPVHPNEKFNALIAGCIGLLLSLAIVYALEYREVPAPDGVRPSGFTTGEGDGERLQVQGDGGARAPAGPLVAPRGNGDATAGAPPPPPKGSAPAEAPPPYTSRG